MGGGEYCGRRAEGSEGEGALDGVGVGTWSRFALGTFMRSCVMTDARRILKLSDLMDLNCRSLVILHSHVKRVLAKHV